MLMLGLKGLRSEENVDNNNYTVNSSLRWTPLGLAQSVRPRVTSLL